jgi:prepilin-type N-terminal cleavage/methylation domain-containing protein
MFKSSNEGLTLIELLIGIVIGSTVVAALVWVITSANRYTGTTPEEYLQEFSHTADITPIGCASRDTDGDGYISCTARDNVTKQLIDVQCASSPFNSGCKLSKGIVNY